MENNLPKTIIKCPHCGAEYTLDEVFYPSDICGFPRDIVKDPTGRILYVGNWKGEEPSYKENFTCEYCGKPFNVELKITTTTTKEDEALDFSNLTSSLF